MSILFGGIVINLNRFICAEQYSRYINIYMDGLPADNNHLHIDCKTQAKASEMLAELNEKIRIATA